MELTLILGISVLGLLFALYLMSNVLRRDTGTEKMREISDAIKAGAEAFMRRQYRTIIYFAVALACAIYILYAFVRAHNANDPASPAELALWTTLSFRSWGTLFPRRPATWACGSPFAPISAQRRAQPET